MKALFSLFGAVLAFLAPVAPSLLHAAKPGEWPEGYIVASDSTSPNMRYGVVIPSRNAAINDEVDTVNYLADLKAHRLLGKIKDSDYFENQNHRGLSVVWADDSTWAVIEYDERFGFGPILVVQPRKNGFSQTEIGKYIQSSLNRIIAKEAHVKDAGCEGQFFCRLTAAGHVKVRALGLTNPKQLAELPTYNAYFQGVYDMNTERWKATDARPVTDQYDDLDTLFRWVSSSQDEPTEEGWAKSLDKSLNEVYDALRFLLPPDRFAQVKTEQIAWLKKRDAAGSTKAKCELMSARIAALQELAW
jgi:uncharacterized protein YecT (DUF1311 family)